MRTHHSPTGKLQIDNRGTQTPAFEDHIESALKIILPLEAAEVFAKVEPHYVIV
jgi:hypothetical protein